MSKSWWQLELKKVKWAEFGNHQMLPEQIEIQKKGIEKWMLYFIIGIFILCYGFIVNALVSNGNPNFNKTILYTGLVVLPIIGYIFYKRIKLEIADDTVKLSISKQGIKHGEGLILFKPEYEFYIDYNYKEGARGANLIVKVGENVITFIYIGALQFKPEKIGHLILMYRELSNMKNSPSCLDSNPSI